MPEASINGTATKSLRQVKAQRQLLEEQVKIADLERQKVFGEKQAKLLEHWYSWQNSEFVGFSGGELYSRVRGRDETDQQYVPPSVASDRRHGDNWPIYRNEIELARFRNASRILCYYNGFARALVLNLTNYVVNKGFSYDAISTDKVPDVSLKVPGKQDPQEIRLLEKMVQKVIDDFKTRNHWPWRERETYRRILRDGEAFLRLYFREDGTTIVRTVEPEQIKNPSGADGTYRAGWSYGLRHQVTDDGGAAGEAVDLETILEYHVVYQDLTDVVHKAGEWQGFNVPASEMIHIKSSNTDSAIKRGLPEFYGDTLNAFYRASTLQRNISVGASVRQAIAMVWQYSFGTQADITSLLAANREYQKVDGITGRTENVQRRIAGETVHVPEGQIVGKHPGSDAAVSDHMQAVQGDLRLGSSAFAAPEFITGNAENANFASSLVASAPFVRMADSQQEHLGTHFRDIFMLVVRHAVTCNVLPQRTLELIDIKVDYPKVIHQDRMQQAHVDQVLVALGAKDRQSVSQEWGYDWEEVKANNMEWEEIHGAFEGTIAGMAPMGKGAGGGMRAGPGQGEGAGQRMDTKESLFEDSSSVSNSDFPATRGQIKECQQCGAGECQNRLQEAESYFADCPRDDEGRCKAGGGQSDSSGAIDKGKSTSSSVQDLHAKQKELHAKRKELQSQHVEFKQARINAFYAIKDEAQAALDKATSHFDSIFDAHGSLAWHDEGQRSIANAFEKYEQSVLDYDGTGFVKDRWNALKDIEDQAQKTLIAAGKQKIGTALSGSPETGHHEVEFPTQQNIDDNRRILTDAISNSRAAQKQIGVYMRHRRDMESIKRGATLESLSYMESFLEADGTCKPGERSDLTGCSPAIGDGGQQTTDKSSSIKAFAAKVNALTDKIPFAATIKGKVADLMKGIHGKLEQRYGTKTANFIMTSGPLVGGYGIMGASLALTGTPGIPVVNDLVGILAHSAIAEVGYQLGWLKPKGTTKSMEAESDEPLPENIKDIVAEAWKEITGQINDLFGQNKDELASLNDHPEVKQLVSEYNALKDKSDQVKESFDASMRDDKAVILEALSRMMTTASLPVPVIHIDVPEVPKMKAEDVVTLVENLSTKVDMSLSDTTRAVARLAETVQQIQEAAVAESAPVNVFQEVIKDKDGKIREVREYEETPSGKKLIRTRKIKW